MKKGRVRLGRNVCYVSFVMVSEYILYVLLCDLYLIINYLFGKVMLQYGGVVICMVFL